MQRFQRWACVFAVASLGVYAGCSDSGVEPFLAPPGLGPARAVSEETAVLERTTPLEEDIVVRSVIGTRGGRIRIDEAGLRVDFPRGAFAEPTEVVVTVHRGAAVAYSFEPSATFPELVRVEQSLKETTAFRNEALRASIEAAYYPGNVEQELQEKSTVFVTELLPIDLDVKTSKIRFYVDHFSGYLLAVD